MDIIRPTRINRLLLLSLIVGTITLASVPARALPDAGGTQLWEARYNGPGNAKDSAASVLVSPDGSRVFVTGTSAGKGGSTDYHTMAYDGAGTELWEARYDGAGAADDEAKAGALSSDGSTVYVTGISWGSGSSFDYATVAYAAASGGQLWEARYNGPANSVDSASSLVPSSDGSKVFVTGFSIGAGSSYDYATVAYDAASGVQLWEARYNGPGNQTDVARSLAASPDGTRVFVTGSSYGTGTSTDYATVAYGAVTGAARWEKRYNGPGNGSDAATGVAASADGSSVFVTGSSFGPGTSNDYATVAYAAATGASKWGRRYNGPGNSDDNAASLAASSDGSRVFVTGLSWGVGTSFDYATVAYDAATGAAKWGKRYNGPGNSVDSAACVSVSPDGSKVFVTGYSLNTGSSFDYATVAYGRAGSELWQALYNGPSNSADSAFSVSPSSDGTSVFVTGSSTGLGTGEDFATLAYAT